MVFPRGGSNTATRKERAQHGYMCYNQDIGKDGDVCQTDCYAATTEVWMYVLYGHNEAKIQPVSPQNEGRYHSEI